MLHLFFVMPFVFGILTYRVFTTNGTHDSKLASTLVANIVTISCILIFVDM